MVEPQNGALKASYSIPGFPMWKVESTAAVGIDPMWVEASRFRSARTPALGKKTWEPAFGYRREPRRCVGRPAFALADVPHRSRSRFRDDAPQPQVVAAFGLFTTNRVPIRSSIKSTSAPARYCRLRGSTTSFTPPRSNSISPPMQASSRLLESALEPGTPATPNVDPKAQAPGFPSLWR